MSAIIRLKVDPVGEFLGYCQRKRRRHGIRNHPDNGTEPHNFVRL
jgi:hypothetical protein